MQAIVELAGVPLFAGGAVLGLVGALLVVLGFAQLLRRRPLAFVLRLLLGSTLGLAGALAVAAVLGVQGYSALTREQVAAVVTVTPRGAQRFEAVLRTPDGRTRRFSLAGDELYVDARILKWTPAANVLGLHTVYELDRIAGRYRGLEDERKAPRTVHALGAERPVDLFGLRRRHAWLAPFLDAEYGSATFAPADRAAALEVRVSTTGLLMRVAAEGRRR